MKHTANRFQASLIAAVLLAFLLSCRTQRLTSTFITAVPTGIGSSEPADSAAQVPPGRMPRSYEQTCGAGEGRPCCFEPLNYAPDTNYAAHFPMKYLRVNVHFVNSADSTNMFPEEEGIRYAREMLAYAGEKIASNHPMRLPIGNQTPCLPLNFRLALVGRPGDSGIYFHYDDELYGYVHKGSNVNHYRREVIEKYGVMLDTVLNIFVMPHHPDSVMSPTYKAFGCGIALGNAVKVAGTYELGTPAWSIAPPLVHELGHILGLSHSWKFNDGCEDTPLNPNCWSPSLPGCDSSTSNNIMDYNVFQNAWTPCQIGKVHYNMSNVKHRLRQLVEPRWCNLREEAQIFIRDSVHWKGMKDLEGNVTIEPGGVLQISCRVSLPGGAKITVKPGGRLLLDNCRLHNDCGDAWQGIEVQAQGGQKGEVIFLGEPVLENTLQQR